MSSSCAALLECQQLLGTEGLVMDLGGCLDEVLEVSASEEVTEIYEFAVVLVFNVDDSPSILTTTNLFASNDNRLLRSDNGEGDNLLNLGIQSALLLVELIVVIRVHLQVVESELLLYALLECAPLLKRQRIGLGNDWDDINNI